MLVQNKERLLSKHDNIRTLEVSVEMYSHLSRLLSNVGRPSWSQSTFLLAGCLIFFLSINVVVGECLHGMIVVALHLQVAVRDNNASRICRVKHRARHQVIWQLDFKQDGLIDNEDEGSIDRLNAYLFVSLIFIAEGAVYEIECISVKFMTLQLRQLRKRGRRLHRLQTDEPVGKDA